MHLMQNNFQPINHLEIMKVLKSDHCLPFMKNCLRDFRHQDHKPGYKLYKKKKLNSNCNSGIISMTIFAIYIFLQTIM